MRKLHFMLQKNTILVNCVGKNLERGWGGEKGPRNVRGEGREVRGRRGGISISWQLLSIQLLVSPTQLNIFIKSNHAHTQYTRIIKYTTHTVHIT